MEIPLSVLFEDMDDFTPAPTVPLINQMTGMELFLSQLPPLNLNSSSPVVHEGHRKILSPGKRDTLLLAHPLI